MCSKKTAHSRGSAIILCGLRLLYQGLPAEAIEIIRGIMAQVDPEKCVGCGRCAAECPASVITIREAEG